MDTTHYTSLLPEVNTGALLRKTLVLLKIKSAASIGNLMLSQYKHGVSTAS
jgi:hypothetical protein